MRNLSKGALALISLLLILASCNPGTYKPLFKTRTDRIIDTLRYVSVVNSKSPSSDVYRIQPYDKLAVRNVTVEQITQSGGGGGQAASQSTQNSGSEGEGFRVETDGNVNLPSVGKIYVMGLTRQEAAEKIQQAYKSTLLKDPLIDVYIIAPKVTILGEVADPGTFILERENMTVVELIGLAGGFTSEANPKAIKIIRGDKTNPEVIYVNLENMQSLASSKLILQNKDIIYVDTDSRFTKYQKSQSGLSVFQTVFVLISTGLLVFTTFFK